MSIFTADAARQLPGPDWLRARRTAAAEQFESAGLPSPDEEIWRYSRVAELDLDDYELAPTAAAGPPPVPPAVVRLLDEHPDRSATIVSVDGVLAAAEIAPRHAATNLVAGRLADDPDGTTALGSALEKPTDVFAVMNLAFSTEPLLVRVPEGVVLDGPVVVVHWFTGEGRAVFPRLVVEAGPNSEARILDVYGSDDAADLVVPVTELTLRRAARLGYVNVQQLGLRNWQIASTVSVVEADGDLESTCAGLGGEYARQRTDCHLEGRGGTGNLRAVYFGEGAQTLDFRTFQDHAAPDTTSDLLFKGALGGSSRSVYSGLIRVEKNARGTNAYQTNRNIKLSDEAWAESVPNLEILNNDVRCSHASAVGPVDEEQRFYLESRGVPRPVAERLIVTGFFDEVLSELPVTAAIAPLRAAVADKLDRRHVE